MDNRKETRQSFADYLREHIETPPDWDTQLFGEFPGTMSMFQKYFTYILEQNTNQAKVNAIAQRYADSEITASRAAFLYHDNRYIIDPLPQTEAEADSIKQVLEAGGKTVRVFTREDANEEAFKHLAPGQSNILHIGTHGYYFPETDKENENTPFQTNDAMHETDLSAFRSGLFLAGAQRTIDNRPAVPNAEDGILTAYEISLQNFNNTKLLVLSACQTGLGDSKGYEGIMGLNRAFKIAGVDYMVLSLWEVPSYQTQELMTLFYRNFSQGTPVEEAFSAARQAMREKYQSPYYWAGFKLIY